MVQHRKIQENEFCLSCPSSPSKGKIKKKNEKWKNGGKQKLVAQTTEHKSLYYV